MTTKWELHHIIWMNKIRYLILKLIIIQIIPLGYLEWSLAKYNSSIVALKVFSVFLTLEINSGTPEFKFDISSKIKDISLAKKELIESCLNLILNNQTL
jgi:hypothetical protein